jgi:hypothetical protein
MPKTNKNKKFSITLEMELFKKIEKMSIDEDRSLSKCINILIKESLERRGY